MSSGFAVSSEIVTHDRAGCGRVRPYAGEDALSPGSVVLLGGRYWLVVRVGSSNGACMHVWCAMAWRRTTPPGIGRPERFGRSGQTLQVRATS